MNSFLAALWLVISMPGLAGPTAFSSPVDRLDLSGEWQMQSAFVATNLGGALSQTGIAPGPWHRVQVPTTVLNALTKGGVYPDIRVGLNSDRIPDSSDEFNARHDLAKFSHLPGKRNPWRDPWWFRREFTLPSLPAGRRFWLHFDAINYRADVWVNGQPIAESKEMAGMFQRFQFDITAQAKPGLNAIAVKVYPVDHPGIPQKQITPLGPDRGYQSDLMYDVTEIMTVGYDCMMTVPDRNFGLWQKVWIDWTGPVEVRNPFVITDLPLPETNRAVLTVSAELVNASTSAVKGVLSGVIADTGVRFSQPVELAAGETRLVTVEPKPVLRNPRLWWPVNYGEQALYSLALSVEIDGATSCVKTVSFGVREAGFEMHEINGYYGRRVLINGQKILCRGGYIQPELMFDWDARRMETEIRYYALANLNLVYFEDIPNPPEPFLELCDRYGILFGNVFYSCFWLRPGKPYPADLPLLERCTVDLVKRYRNHPSLILYMAMNEEDTRQDIYEMWRKHVVALDGTRWFIPSGYFPSDRKDVGEWFKKDLPTGMTDKGASYSWAEPEQYFRWVSEARNWMFMMEGGAASVPPMSSLNRFLPEVKQPTPAVRDRLYPLDADWAHHGANHYFKGFDAALRRLHGEPSSVADYVWKAHLVTADQHRSMFEAVNHRLWGITSGFTQWKINACEPSIQWQIFDWYLKPMVSWFYIKKATEPLHIQLNLPGRTVSLVNTGLMPQPNLQVRAQVFDLDGKLLWDKAAPASAPANGYRESITVPEPPTATPVYFVKLRLNDAQGRLLSDNFYWLRARGTEDLKALQTLPLVKLETTCAFEQRGTGIVARVKVVNPTDRVAFFVQLAITRSRGGPEILPVYWEDNYFSLLPGESRQVTARFAANDSSPATPALEIGGWNVESDYNCTRLTLSSREIKAGVPITVSADITDTFLDGSRVTVYMDRKPAVTAFAWARGETVQTIAATLTLTNPGLHEISVGSKKAGVRVQP